MRVIQLSLKGKLNRYKHHIVTGKKADKNASKFAEKHLQDTKHPLEHPVVSLGSQIPNLDQWEALQATPIYFESECIMSRKVNYSLDHQHGRYTFSKLHKVIEAWNEKRIVHPLSSADYQGSDLLFFDTETTGLGGGVGNTIFLLGYARVTDESLQVTQLFLPSPVAEVAFYHRFLEDIKESKRLVTYNGKAFDWPQVKTRHTLIRDELPKLPSFGHFDLLHASRRLWKDQLYSCRLSIVEEEVLNFKRADDTPGYMAPILYFEYLKTLDPNVVKGVFEHNEWDVCSLVTLYIHISSMLLDLADSNLSIRESIQVGRWYKAIGETDYAIYHLKKGINQAGSDGLKSKELLASIYKKQKHYEAATQLWEDVSNQSRWSREVDIELSKLYEHQHKDAEKALHYALKACQQWNESRKRTKKAGDREEYKELVHRIERLKKKTEKHESNKEMSLFDHELSLF